MPGEPSGRVSESRLVRSLDIDGFAGGETSVPSSQGPGCPANEELPFGVKKNGITLAKLVPFWAWRTTRAQHAQVIGLDAQGR